MSYLSCSIILQKLGEYINTVKSKTNWVSLIFLLLICSYLLLNYTFAPKLGLFLLNLGEHTNTVKSSIN